MTVCLIAQPLSSASRLLHPGCARACHPSAHRSQVPCEGFMSLRRVAELYEAGVGARHGLYSRRLPRRFVHGAATRGVKNIR